MKLLSVIKYEGDNSLFVWKHPDEDFNTSSQLIVHESQEAIFFANGKALDVFGPGRYTLTTENFPFIKGLLRGITGGENAFHCEVYFVNLINHMAIRWGTDSKVQYLDSTYNFPISFGASGEMTLKIQNSKKFVVKVVGTENYIDREMLMIKFRGILMTKVKSYMARIMREKKINIFEIDSQLDFFSSELKALLIDDFLDVGIDLLNFYVSTVVKPEDDPLYSHYKELYYRQYADIAEAKLKQQVDIIEEQTEAQRTIIESESLAKKRQIEGYTYHQERGYDIAEKAAANEGVGTFTSAGIGLGVMAGVGNTIGGQINDTFEKTNSTQTNIKFCPQCGCQLDANALFCSQCGKKLVSNDKCSGCGYTFTNSNDKFCPQCGRKRGE